MATLRFAIASFTSSGLVRLHSLSRRVSIHEICFVVPSASPAPLSFRSVFIIRFSLCPNLVERARSLGWIRTLACGAGDPGFKSQRARQDHQCCLFLRCSFVRGVVFSFV